MFERVTLINIHVWISLFQSYHDSILKILTISKMALHEGVIAEVLDSEVHLSVSPRVLSHNTLHEILDLREFLLSNTATCIKNNDDIEFIIAAF